MNTESLINDILPGLVNGDSQKTIAHNSGYSQPTISRWKDKLSEHIEGFQLQLIEGAGKETIENIIATIKRANILLTNNDLSSKDLSDSKVILELSHKKEVLVGQSLGVLPSQTQSTTINNLLSVHTGPSVSDIERIQELITMRQEQDIIDVDPESVSSKDDNIQSVNSGD